MEIESSFVNGSGQTVKVRYFEGDPLDGQENVILQAVHAFCFSGDKLVLVQHPKSGWMPPGGGIEPGENYEEAVIREVREETNMRVLNQELIGCQDVFEPERTVRQMRSVCSVEPIGPFVPSAEEETLAIKLMDPRDYKEYFDWGEIGDRLMSRALELKDELKKR